MLCTHTRHNSAVTSVKYQVCSSCRFVVLMFLWGNQKACKAEGQDCSIGSHANHHPFCAHASHHADRKSVSGGTTTSRRVWLYMLKVYCINKLMPSYPHLTFMIPRGYEKVTNILRSIATQPSNLCFYSAVQQRQELHNICHCRLKSRLHRYPLLPSALWQARTLKVINVKILLDLPLEQQKSSTYNYKKWFAMSTG